MALKVVGAGVGRTGTNSLKSALETLLGGRCHHMYEIMANPHQIPGWMAAIDGQETDWHGLLDGYVAQVDWPGAVSPCHRWFESVARLMAERFCAQLDNPTAMMDAYERHSAAVRAAVPPDRLLEWTPTDGWDPLCERLGVPVPAEPFPLTNQTTEFRANLGLPPI